MPAHTEPPAAEPRGEIEVTAAGEADGVATVVLARPAKHNALTPGMRAALLDAFRWASEEPAVRAVVLRGAGRSFCAGQDIRGERTAYDSVQQGIWHREHQNLGRAVADCAVPVVAALHGHVLGRGLDIALAADIRIAAESARLGFPEVRHGMTIGGGGLRRLVRAVGESRAMDLLLTGDSVDAATARAWGLVTRVVPDDRLTDEARALAARLADLPGPALYATKHLVRAALDGPVEAGSWTDTAVGSLLAADRAAARARPRDPDDTGHHAPAER
ncbi:enoyl-CoA hydratase/isomerase family protein [Streptomyces sp. NPDC050560]|uniref:enoyl-CoA hydratase/isomerase family protein n=1 Tax=Streptomyces sp. NPDC050560 TaxID=3365630 RepID=UPI00379C03C4